MEGTRVWIWRMEVKINRWTMRCREFVGAGFELLMQCFFLQVDMKKRLSEKEGTGSVSQAPNKKRQAEARPQLVSDDGSGNGRGAGLGLQAKLQGLLGKARPAARGPVIEEEEEEDDGVEPVEAKKFNFFGLLKSRK